MKYTVGGTFMQIFNVYSFLLSLFTPKLELYRFTFFFSNSAQFFFPTWEKKTGPTYLFLEKCPKTMCQPGKKILSPFGWGGHKIEFWWGVLIFDQAPTISLRGPVNKPYDQARRPEFTSHCVTYCVTYYVTYCATYCLTYYVRYLKKVSLISLKLCKLVIQEK